MGELIRCITDDGLVMATAIDATDIVAEAMRIHKTTPVMTTVLGRLLMGASIMGNMLKEDEASITLRINGGGEGGSLIAVSDSKGNPRGYAQNPGLLIMPDKKGDLDVLGAVGTNGMFSVVKDFGSGDPYIGQIPIVKGNIYDDITAYYGVSEQIPTIVLLDVAFDEKWNYCRAGGLLIQLLPAADNREIVKIEENFKHIPTINEMLLSGLTPYEICEKALIGFNLEILERNDISYKCSCSMDRVKRSLLTLGRDEIRNLASDDGFAEICCHFCDKKYKISARDLEKLANS